MLHLQPAARGERPCQCPRCRLAAQQPGAPARARRRRRKPALPAAAPQRAAAERSTQSEAAATEERQPRSILQEHIGSLLARKQSFLDLDQDERPEQPEHVDPQHTLRAYMDD
jgi:hypothetical protein